MKDSRAPIRRVAVSAAATLAALTLTACGGDGDNGATESSPRATASPEAADGRHNAADVTFAQSMIVHHRQAVAMSDMAADHGASAQVEALAEKIKKAQEPEITTMSGWLRSWGEDVPEGMETDGMDHGMDSSPMPGMMGDEQMEALRGTSGAAFDTMFLTMMIQHHKGAIAMAETERKQGAYGPAKQLADEVVATQRAEVTQMEKMLRGED
ncbi:DUF305 domain-containing protein [Streptomyces sp. NPDC047928]|uniref:DUF305 domain-containing protein n=1 Tax=unclassified Streptomyces TaxID=2593676 RepID=UPI0037238808